MSAEVSERVRLYDSILYYLSIKPKRKLWQNAMETGKGKITAKPNKLFLSSPENKWTRREHVCSSKGMNGVCILSTFALMWLYFWFYFLFCPLLKCSKIHKDSGTGVFWTDERKLSLLSACWSGKLFGFIALARVAKLDILAFSRAACYLWLAGWWCVFHTNL